MRFIPRQSRVIVIIEVVAALLTLATAGWKWTNRGPSKEETAKHVADSTKVARRTADSVARVARQRTADAQAKARKDSIAKLPPPCNPHFEADSSDFMSLEGITSLVKAVNNCPKGVPADLLGGQAVDSAGHISSEGGGHLANLEATVSYFNNIYQDTWVKMSAAYDNMPGIPRKALLIPALQAVLPEVLKHLTTEEVNNYLLRLEWNRDIEAVSPNWLRATKWPNDSSAIQMPGSTLKLTHEELWIRMFWRRRGELVFLASKSVTSQLLAARK